jgi:hypothetical protein
VADHVLQRA